MPTLIHNIGTLQTPLGSFPHAGAAQGENRKYHNAAVLCEGGIIRAVYENGALPEVGADTQTIDAQGRLVTPGLIDAHTHLVFGGWRQNEIPLKLKGAGYLDILRAGGGILSTVRATRKASEEELFEKSRAFLDEMLAQGVTTAELKSGYGLDKETELLQLKVMRSLNNDEHKRVDIVSTFLGAHAVPEEYKGRTDEYLDFIIGDVLPCVAKDELAEFCDVFCEQGVFSVEQSRRLLQAAKEYGLGLKLHADEIVPLGGAELAAELSAVSADHLLHASDAGIRAMRDAGTVATLLPLTAFALKESYARGREMIDFGCAVALATDLNPGSCFSGSIPLTFALACIYMHLTIEEAITALTLNGAAALNRADSIGSIEVGKKGDFVVLNSDNYHFLPYYVGMNCVNTTIKEGVIYPVL